MSRPAGYPGPSPFRAQPQVDGAVHDALAALEPTVEHELDFAGENALIVADDDLALPNGDPLGAAGRRGSMGCAPRWPPRLH